MRIIITLFFFVYYLGNIKIHQVTSADEYELLIKLEDFENERKFARYKTFFVGDPSSQYKLTVKGYSGNAGLYNYYVHFFFLLCHFEIQYF